MKNVVKTIIKKDNLGVEPVEIVKPSDKVDENYGCFTYELTEEQIEALKNGDVACLEVNYEYTVLIYLKMGEEK